MRFLELDPVYYHCYWFFQFCTMNPKTIQTTKNGVILPFFFYTHTHTYSTQRICGHEYSFITAQPPATATIPDNAVRALLMLT